ncbi:putative beta-lysine N-acetyltransferase [Ammoniphilus sp. 3BR4]|uniref:putative beta-lysine N-acetyltransferase n=1 Tax=Ammoniphilus sp. 3BR4 TaxID=3158265 RepID=UPI00346615AA
MQELPYISREEAGQDYIMQIYLDFANERLRVDDFRGNAVSVMVRVRELAKEHNFSKIFIKTRWEDVGTLMSRGYMLEGIFKGYFHGSDAYSMALYFTEERRTSEHWMEEDDILHQVMQMEESSVPSLPEGYSMRLAVTGDAGKLAELYGAVFAVYPTPMDNEDYVRKVMEEGTVFQVIEWKGQIVAAASGEINEDYHNAEMTDCATLPEHRKHGLMKILIHALEAELVRRHIYCHYSLARALSFGMNAVFRQLGYEYTGRLTKNCNIFDKLEDMNLWVKPIGR